MAIEKNYFAGSGNKRAQASWSKNMYYPEKQNNGLNILFCLKTCTV